MIWKLSIHNCGWFEWRNNSHHTVSIFRNEVESTVFSLVATLPATIKLQAMYIMIV